MTDVYYAGSRSQWARVDIQSPNACLVTAALHFGKIEPVSIQSVTLSETSVVTDVENERTLTVRAVGSDGLDISEYLVWRVSPEETGVSVREDGTVTVAPEAAAGRYTLTAEPDGTYVIGEAVSAVLTVTPWGDVSQAEGTCGSLTVNAAATSATVPLFGDLSASASMRVMVLEGDFLPVIPAAAYSLES